MRPEIYEEMKNRIKENLYKQEESGFQFKPEYEQAHQIWYSRFLDFFYKHWVQNPKNTTKDALWWFENSYIQEISESENNTFSYLNALADTLDYAKNMKVNTIEERSLALKWLTRNLIIRTNFR
jgi:hypothetical protein